MIFHQFETNNLSQGEKKEIKAHTHTWPHRHFKHLPKEEGTYWKVLTCKVKVTFVSNEREGGGGRGGRGRGEGEGGREGKREVRKRGGERRERESNPVVTRECETLVTSRQKSVCAIIERDD